MQMKHNKGPSGWVPFNIVLSFETSEEVSYLTDRLRLAGEKLCDPVLKALAIYIARADVSIDVLPEETL